MGYKPATELNEWMKCYIWYSEEGTGQAAAPPSPLLTVPNKAAHR